jgi:uncharacterized protein YecE (DUF72 family)
VDTASSRRHLEGISGALGAVPWVLEVRHRSWFAPAGLAFLRSLPCSVAHLDLPASRDHLPDDAPQVGPLGYLRLHGRNASAWFDAKAGRDDRYNHRYTPTEIDGLAARALQIASAVESTLVVANNHYGGKAVAAALEIKARVTGAPVPAPSTILEAFPDLRAWTRPVGQGSLFT